MVEKPGRLVRQMTLSTMSDARAFAEFDLGACADCLSMMIMAAPDCLSLMMMS